MSPPPSIEVPRRESKVKLRTYSKDPWHPKQVQQFIDSWRLTPEQVEKLWKLQRKLKDVHHWKNEPEHVLRYMFAPHGYDAAEANFRKMVQWRLDNNIDTILEDYKPPRQLLESAVAGILHGFDRDGDPIYVERGGAFDTSLLKKLGHDELLKYAIWTRELHTRGEWLDRFERLQARRMRAITVIYDLKGNSTKHLNPKVLGKSLGGTLSRFQAEQKLTAPPNLHLRFVR
jgi:CRAL/TRIO domain